MPLAYIRGINGAEYWVGTTWSGIPYGPGEERPCVDVTHPAHELRRIVGGYAGVPFDTHEEAVAWAQADSRLEYAPGEPAFRRRALDMERHPADNLSDEELTESDATGVHYC